MSGAVEDVELWIKGKPPEPNVKGAQLQYFEHLNVIKYNTSKGKLFFIFFRPKNNIRAII